MKSDDLPITPPINPADEEFIWSHADDPVTRQHPNREPVRLTDRGYLPPGTDVESVLASGDARALHAVWTTYHHIRWAHEQIEAIYSGDLAFPPDGTALFESRLSECAGVTRMQALEANHRLVEVLTLRRWLVMRDAVEAGDSWHDIGAAVEMTEWGAHDWYALRGRPYSQIGDRKRRR
ncbi:hypothetical protein [Nocardia asiatica]|uniref:hypothetical protein n=1 Tax=Nocardia asiatica TaxID=209252 RepID=UPI003EDFA2A8